MVSLYVLARRCVELDSGMDDIVEIRKEAD